MAINEFKATLRGVNKNQLENMSMKATSRVLELKKKREESIANMSNIVSELDQSQVSQMVKNEDLNFSQMAAIRA